MNLNELNTFIKTVSLAYPTVQEYEQGDIYEFLNSGEHKYPCIFLTIESISTGEDTQNINATLFYVDRLLSDSSNKLDIQTVALTALKSIKEKLEETNYINFTSVNYTPFTEKFADLCAGAFVQCTIQVNDTLECDEYDLSSLTITENGLYNVLGYSKVIVNVGGGKWGEITGNIEDQTDLVEYIAEQAPNIEAGRSIYFTQGEGNSIVINAENQTEFTGSNGIVVSQNNDISIDTKLIDKAEDDVTYKNYRGDELIYSEHQSVRIPFDKKYTNDGIYWEEGNLDIKSTDRVNIALDGITVLDIDDSKVNLCKGNDDNVLYCDNDNLTMYGPEGRVFEQGGDMFTIFDNDDEPLIECQDENITIYKDGNDWIKTTSAGEYIHYLEGNEVLKWTPDEFRLSLNGDDILYQHNNGFNINNENGSGFINNNHTDGDNWVYSTNICNYDDDLLNSGRSRNRYGTNQYNTTLSNNGNDIIYSYRSENNASENYNTSFSNSGTDILYAYRTYNRTGGFESGENYFYNSNGDTIIDVYYNGQSNVYNALFANGYDTFAQSYYNTDNETGWTSLKFPNGDDCIDLMKNGDDEIISITIGGTTLDLDEAKLQKLKDLLED